MNKIGNFLWGIVFITLGLILGLNALEIINFNIFFDGWWTLFIIIPCFIDLFKEKEKTGNLIGLFIGVFLLLCCLDILSFSLLWKLMLPSILVIIGLSFIFKDVINVKTKKEIKKINDKNNIDENYCATFGSQNLDFFGQEFKGCELTTVFGGIKCDLSRSDITKDVVIKVSAIFGGVDILIPDNVNIKVVSTSLFGGVSNKKNNQYKDNNKTIYINATCVFGGVDIK